jgi:hypothetical protein
VLPELTLAVHVPSEMRVPPPKLEPDTRVFILRSLFDGENVLVNLPGKWLEVAEALLMGLPGPLRAEASFSAGIHFSLSRMHRLELLYDDKGKAKLRSTGQNVRYIDPAATELPEQLRSPWFDFVERCYATGAMTLLSGRTSRCFADTSLVACERVGSLFEAIDRIHHDDGPTMLQKVLPSLTAQAEGVEAEAHQELVATVARHLPDRLRATTMPQARELWCRLLDLWRQPGPAAKFAQPLVMRMAVHLAELDPVEGARLLGEIAEEIDKRPDGALFAATIDEVISRLLLCVRQAPDDTRDQAKTVARCWSRFRPDSQSVRQLVAACEPQSVSDGAN